MFRSLLEQASVQGAVMILGGLKIPECQTDIEAPPASLVDFFDWACKVDSEFYQHLKEPFSHLGVIAKNLNATEMRVKACVLRCVSKKCCQPNI